jgi:outer membrane usher protein
LSIPKANPISLERRGVLPRRSSMLSRTLSQSTQAGRSPRGRFTAIALAAVIWSSGAKSAPMTVTIAQQEGTPVHIRVNVAAAAEPVLAWAGTRGPGPYRLALIWSDSQLHLTEPLPALPRAGTGPVQSIALRTVGTTDRLEILLREPVYPSLRRHGGTWVLVLEPVPLLTAAALQAASPPAPAAADAATPSAPQNEPSPASAVTSAPAIPGPAHPPQPAVRPQESALAPRSAPSSRPAASPSSTPSPAPAPLAGNANTSEAQATTMLSPNAGAARAPSADSTLPVPDKSSIEPEQLLVDFTVNGLRQADIARAEQLPNGQVLIASENWTAARLVTPGQPVTMSDGTPAYALDAIPGVRYSVDKQRMSIDVEAPAGAFAAASMDTGQPTEAPPPRPPAGAFLNYDAVATRPAYGAPATTAATLEAVGFGPFGTAVASGLASDDGVKRKFERLDTYWQYDMPESMQTLVIGDTIGVAGGWSRPVRYGGVRWGRDFGLRPGFVTMPLPSVAGQAALPSTVDVLVNDSRRFSQSVRPGPFDVTNVPVITGAGEVNLVVRDLLGRQTVITQSYYASPRLLAKGLTDFSFEAGWLRTGFGEDSQYRDAFGAATVRRGVTSQLTGEGRLEVQPNRQAAGFEFAGLLETWGVGRLAVAGSRDELHGAPEHGAVARVGIERSTPVGGGAIQYEHATRGFAPFGETGGPMDITSRSREQLLASIGGRLWGAINGGVSYARRTLWDGERDSTLGFSLSIPVGSRASLTVAAARRLDPGRTWSGAVNLNVPLGEELYAGARMERQDEGQTRAAVMAVRNPPAGPGLGWRTEASTDERQRARAGLQYNTNHGDITADIVADADARVSSRVGARGTVGMMAGVPFASRPVGQGSFAVVKIEGVPGVPIKRSNQVVAQTDARGLAFVPGLVPWHKNQIEIAPEDLPLDAEVGAVTQQAVPYARSGALVRFDVRRSRQALLVLRQADGQPVPVGTRVQVMPGGAQFEAGRRGEVWLTDLSGDTQHLKVSWTGHGCELQVNVPPSDNGAPVTLGPLVCEGKSP